MKNKHVWKTTYRYVVEAVEKALDEGWRPSGVCKYSCDCVIGHIMPPEFRDTLPLIKIDQAFQTEPEYADGTTIWALIDAKLVECDYKTQCLMSDLQDINDGLGRTACKEEVEAAIHRMRYRLAEAREEHPEHWEA